MRRLLVPLAVLAACVNLAIHAFVLGLALVPAVWIVRAASATESAIVIALSLGAAYVATSLSLLVLLIAVKWLTFFRAREGDYAFLSLYSLRWVLVGTLVGFAKIVVLRHLQGTEILNVFYRAMGARIGRGVVINSCNLFDFDLLDVGDDSFIGGDAVVIAHVGEAGRLRLRPVRIGRGCTVGQSSVVLPGATIEDGAILGALSLLPKGRTLPAGSVWGGNPLERLDDRAARGSAAVDAT